MSKLITYFSASGVTKRKAEELASAVNGDVQEIIPANSYSDADLNWFDNNCRANREMQDANAHVEMSNTIDISAYDDIYVGFPIWWGTAPKIINTFLESQDFSSKRIVLFATSGGSNINKALKDMKNAYPDYHFVSAVLTNGTIQKDLI